MILKFILMILIFLSVINCNVIISEDLETQPVVINFETLNHTLNPNEIRCYGFYGCFSVDFPWKSEQRAHAVL